jgi:hypothetical protein
VVVLCAPFQRLLYSTSERAALSPREGPWEVTLEGGQPAPGTIFWHPVRLPIRHSLVPVARVAVYPSRMERGARSRTELPFQFLGFATTGCLTPSFSLQV